MVGPHGDPEGLVSIIDTNKFSVQTAGFNSFNASAAALKAAGVRLSGPYATLTQDLEPEYITVSEALITLPKREQWAHLGRTHRGWRRR